MTLGGGNQATIYHLQAEIIQFLKLAVPAWKAITAIQPLKKVRSMLLIFYVYSRRGL